MQTVLRDHLKHFQPLSSTSGWPCEFGTWFSDVHCYAVIDLCLHGDSQNWDQVLGKTREIAHSMHTNARCLISARSSWFISYLADWSVISSYNKPRKCHNITSEVQRWQSSWQKVKPESSAGVSMIWSINQFNGSWEPTTLATAAKATICLEPIVTSENVLRARASVSSLSTSTFLWHQH